MSDAGASGSAAAEQSERPAPAWTRSGFAYPALFLGSVIDSTIFPWPIEFPLLAIMLRGRGHVFPAAAVVTAGSVLGCIIAYVAGTSAYDAVSAWLAGHENWAAAVDAARIRADERGAWAVFLGMMTPVVQVASFAAGAAGVGFWAFLLASIAGRTVRYGSMAVLVFAFGPRIMRWWRARSKRTRLTLIALFTVAFVVALVWVFVG